MIAGGELEHAHNVEDQKAQHNPVQEYEASQRAASPAWGRAIRAGTTMASNSSALR